MERYSDCIKFLFVTWRQPYISVPSFSPTRSKKRKKKKSEEKVYQILCEVYLHIIAIPSLSFWCSQTAKRKWFFLILQSLNPQKEQNLQTLSVCFANSTQSLIDTEQKTDYRYPGIKDTLLPWDILLLILTLLGITCVAAISWYRTPCLVKSGNHNIIGDGYRTEDGNPVL